MFSFRRVEEIAGRFLKNRSKFANTLVKLVMRSNGTGSECGDVDILPACELDEVLNVLLDLVSFYRQERTDSSCELRVEGVDVEKDVRDLAKRNSSISAETLCK